ncbi:MAG: hypothetical protein AUK47_11605 [Deltaproteobacteria bacterium CG2_30_63_29]|nr:MAG: hypothetical protein AUK47_11605 [Deltaproteobacteria bacterium CG2_30_63_29]PIV98645.1 MAG: hypothetical protein COW42_13655 [Deltaproteobacteria bacterium CG17_big_fil_post_rev_8_21_14_2_50_63_7]PJB34269.1 MAG: hypothetical protein CO108_28650 [Deltaproteobacteria bacterium CG_4_9_14_3_um_filter_63_12]
MKHTYHIMGKSPRKIEVEQVGAGPMQSGDFRLTLDGAEERCSATWTANRVKLVIGHRVHDCYVDHVEGSYTVHIDGRRIPVDLLSDSQLRRRNATGADTSDGSPLVTSPMIGKVVEVHVSIGDTVKVGDGLLVIEAMKMENEIVARRSGRIEAIRVEPGDKVEMGKPLIRFAESEG